MGCSASTSDPVAFSGAQLQLRKIDPHENSKMDEHVFHDQYILGEKLGRGAFAQIRAAIRSDSTGTPKKYAAKIIERDGRQSEASDRPAVVEASVWSSIGQHSNCVHLHEVFHSKDLTYLVMERCTASLSRYIGEFPAERKFSERALGQLLYQMLQGIAHVHSFRIVHADIKPDNFLMGGEYGNVVKLGDFGFAAPLPDEGKLKGCFGTAPYLCPEMIGTKRYDEKADIWSLGVIAYVFLFGTFPYMPPKENRPANHHDANRAIKLAIMNGKSPSFTPACTERNFRTVAAVTFAKTLLSYSASERPSAAKALRLEYMEAIAKNRHADDMDLPSLRPMVHLAARCGAFAMHKETFEPENLDVQLNALQVERTGVPLPAPRLLGRNTHDQNQSMQTGKNIDGATTKRSMCHTVSGNGKADIQPLSITVSTVPRKLHLAGLFE